ncbi:hypothetical protein B566_EDAN009937, partial [Ephemera danica]
MSAGSKGLQLLALLQLYRESRKKLGGWECDREESRFPIVLAAFNRYLATPKTPGAVLRYRCNLAAITYSNVSVIYEYTMKGKQSVVGVLAKILETTPSNHRWQQFWLTFNLMTSQSVRGVVLSRADVSHIFMCELLNSNYADFGSRISLADNVTKSLKGTIETVQLVLLVCTNALLKTKGSFLTTASSSSSPARLYTFLYWQPSLSPFLQLDSRKIDETAAAARTISALARQDITFHPPSKMSRVWCEWGFFAIKSELLAAVVAYIIRLGESRCPLGQCRSSNNIRLGLTNVVRHPPSSSSNRGAPWRRTLAIRRDVAARHITISVPPHPRPSRHRRVPPPPAAEEEEDAGELPPSPPRHSPPPPAPEPRLSQLFDRLSHLTELSHSLTHSPPTSPRLLPRRPRAQPPSPPS